MDEFKPLPEDAYLAVRVELSVDELNYIEKLLNCEIVNQVRRTLEEQDPNPEKVIKLLSLFESFRILDDQIMDFIFAIEQYKKELGSTSSQYQDTLIISKNMCKVYKMLTSETAKMRLPDEIEKMKNEFNQIIGNKLDNGLKNSFDPRELDQTNPTKSKPKTNKSKESKKTKEDFKSPIPINVFGIKGLA
jgi:hypothetical protein